MRPAYLVLSTYKMSGLNEYSKPVWDKIDEEILTYKSKSQIVRQLRDYINSFMTSKTVMYKEIYSKFLGSGFEARGSKGFAEIKIEGSYRAADMGRI